MDPVPTQYIEREGASMAYQVAGNGPVDVVFFFEIFGHLDLQLTDPDIHHNYEGHARYSRSVIFQRRGFGLSETVPYMPTLEQQADDVLAIMDAIGSRHATLVGIFTTCLPMALVAAKAPERVDALVLVEPLAQGTKSSDNLHGWTEAEVRAVNGLLRQLADRWGSGDLVGLIDPSMLTPYNRRLMALLERCSATPTAARSHFDWAAAQDIRGVLKMVQAPTRVLKYPGTPFPEAAVRYVAELTPDATFESVSPLPPGSTIGQSWRPIAANVEEVVTGATHSPDADRFLGTVLFTDIVSSTELLSRVGDSAYREFRESHEREVRTAIETGGGSLLTVTGDGTMSVFESPTAAVRCAEKICREAATAGVEVRAGIHTGELERDATNVTGLTVHIGARVGAAAEPGQVLVSRTVHDLVAGSGLTFASRGSHELKGISGSWELFALAHAGEQPENLPRERSMQTQMDKMVVQTARRAPGFVRAAVRLGNAIERRRARTR